MPPTLGQQAAAILFSPETLAQVKARGSKLTPQEVADIIDGCQKAAKRDSKAAPSLSTRQVVLDVIYATYPRKVAPREAKVSIDRAINRVKGQPDPTAYLLERTKLFAAAVATWPISYRYTTDGRDLCPMPATWFNQGRYDDDPKEWRRFGARKAAEHMHISPPEPEGWRQAFPDFMDKDKPWNQLQPAQQAFIVQSMELADAATETPAAVQAE